MIYQSCFNLLTLDQVSDNTVLKLGECSERPRFVPEILDHVSSPGFSGGWGYLFALRILAELSMGV